MYERLHQDGAIETGVYVRVAIVTFIKRGTYGDSAIESALIEHRDI